MDEYSKHKEYLSKGKFSIDLPISFFNDEYIKEIEKNGHWYKALTDGTLKPITKTQKKFVNVLLHGKSDNLGQIGIAWRRYITVKENWGELYDMLQKCEEDEKKVLASILKIKSEKPDDIITKLITSSQNLNGFLGADTSYSEIVHKTAKKLKIDVAGKPIKIIEQEIGQEVLKQAISKMNEEEKEKLEAELSKIAGDDYTLLKSGTLLATLATANLSGFGVYMLATTSLSALSGLIGITFSFATYTALTSTIAFVTGPAGWIGLGIYAIWQFTDVDYKKLIPSIIYIHWLREKYIENKSV